MEKDLSFKPMSEGLGFHPFSDGLPYAPLSKTSVNVAGTDIDTASARARALLGTGAVGPVTPRRPGANSLERGVSNGLGATAAGQPRFATQLPVKIASSKVRAERETNARAERETPAQSPLGERAARAPMSAPAHSPLGTLARTPMPQNSPLRSGTPGPTITVARPAPAPADEEEFLPQAEFGFFYLIKRVLAFGIDSVLNIALCAAVLGIAGSRLGISAENLSNPSMAFLSIAFLLTFNWAMITAQEVIAKTTIGKRLFGLHLNGTGSALFLRAFFFLPSMGFSGLGVLWALFDGRRRCWHDHVVDVQPEEI